MKRGPKCKSIEDQFWSSVTKLGPDDCWNWAKRTNKCGYGVISRRKKTLLSNRLSWTFHFGEIPEGLFVCHSCDNPPCVNPNHLWLGTNKDNVDDKVSKGREAHVRGEANGGSRLTKSQVDAIRKEYASNTTTQSALAIKYNVSYVTIHYVVRNKLWV